VRRGKVQGGCSREHKKGIIAVIERVQRVGHSNIKHDPQFWWGGGGGGDKGDQKPASFLAASRWGGGWGEKGRRKKWPEFSSGPKSRRRGVPWKRRPRRGGKSGELNSKQVVENSKHVKIRQQW